MIEKIRITEQGLYNEHGTFLGTMPKDTDSLTLANKINELVDAVNGILAMQEQYATIYKEDIVPMLTPQNEEPADPYAEQRKWIGKLCRFWDFVYDRDYFDTLKGITDEGLFIGYSGSWKHCEPVKPDDNIIYKGGDNE